MHHGDNNVILINHSEPAKIESRRNIQTIFMCPHFQSSKVNIRYQFPNNHKSKISFYFPHIFLQNFIHFPSP